MEGVTPRVEQLNDTFATITWNKKSAISVDVAYYYGYTLEYTTDMMGYKMGSSVQHDPHNDNHTIFFSNFVLNKEYQFQVRPFRTMDNELEYGRASDGFTAKFKQLSKASTTTPS